MELDYYLWRNKISQNAFAKKLHISLSTLSQVVCRKNSPSLLTAVKIVKATNGVVTYEDLLRTRDRLEMVKLKDWEAELAEEARDED